LKQRDSLQILTGGNGGCSPSDGERRSSEGGNTYEESRAPRDEASAWSRTKTMEIFEKTKFAKTLEIYEWREYKIRNIFSKGNTTVMLHKKKFHHSCMCPANEKKMLH
jgi:hypothetical protein